MEQEHVLFYARHLSRTGGIGVAVLDYTERTFLRGAEPEFCSRCRFGAGGRCNALHTHLYGCYEAERWNHLNIYYCPLSLGFIAATVTDGSYAAYALVSGPLVIGSLADTLADTKGRMAEQILELPCRTAEDTTSLSRIQAALCAYLSGDRAGEPERAQTEQGLLHNALYDMAERTREGAAYPLDLEKKLQRMIIQGDRDGAREIINQLLSHMYLSAGADFDALKQAAQDLVVLFSRAALDGGADAQQIFGTRQGVDAAIAATGSIDELGIYLTNLFYRFVGYVFDFVSIRHTDVIHKVISFIRENYTSKLTLEDVSAHVYLSRPYLSRILGEELGMSFTDFVNSFRVEKAKELLLSSRQSLAEIAAQVGFSDQSYFTKVFHKTVGQSPGEFRKGMGRMP